MIATIAATLAPFTTASAFFVMAWAAYHLGCKLWIEAGDLIDDWQRADFGDVHSEEN